MFKKSLSAAAFMMLSLAAVAPAAAEASDAGSCASVRLAEPAWTDISSTNGVTTTILSALGYTPELQNISVAIAYQSLKIGSTDIFLGNWMPAQGGYLDPLLKQDAVEIVTPNLRNVRFTLGVPSYVADAGVKNFADLNKYADKFGKKIYGIEAGAAGNVKLQTMIDHGDFNLRDWKLVESSEQAMVAEAIRATKHGDWIVFLAWEPHPMNTKMHLTYLAGGDAYFGANYGSTTVNTLARKGFLGPCPNLARLFKQLHFSVDMENQIMASIMDGHMQGAAAAADWLKTNPGVLDAWLAGVTTRDGKQPALAVVRHALGLEAPPATSASSTSP